MNPIKIFLVEDSNFLIDLFQRVVANEAGFEIVDIAKNAAEAIEKIQYLKVDIILLDLDIPESSKSQLAEMGGLDVLEFIKKNKIDTKVLVLSAHAEYKWVKLTVKMDIEGYLHKDNATGSELFDAMRKICGGGKHFDKKIQKLINEPFGIAEPPKKIVLSKREKQVIEGKVKGDTDKMIAYELGLKAETIQYYIKNIKSKLGAENIASMLRIIYEKELL